MSKKLTCGGCDHLKINKLPNMAIAFCGKDSVDGAGPIVPHRSAALASRIEWEVVLWRVPDFCTEPDRIKGDTPCAEADQVRMVVKL